ncbi:C2 family cysteine protease [Legionella israelensis]|uniref:Calpain family cysteine protease n=1 Tax=Legionella israelensis TaxID=454 RepID=A0A0W0WIH4_9GAMM|nr:C2 family cysteine protease [Legionella israelensis]KTD32122.1 Calpain family cysteine protease [Legionella israelensis]QBS10242.1 hypothetical protein E4T55_10460 [Legionella israelensis]SCY20987.1 Calpain family cysteine protease [Legionella israelensis DSM 19235]STX59836.1 Calpain family cysteine protease [Legionella israelensis]
MIEEEDLFNSIHAVNVSDDEFIGLFAENGNLLKRGFKAVKGEIFAPDSNWTDIKQTSLGDCYFLVALQSVMLRNPELVRDMIRDNGHNTVSVRFYRKSDFSESYQPWIITIDKTIYELPIISDYGHREAWVFLFEKAYAVFRQFLNLEKYYGRSYSETISGGYGHEALEHLLGCSSSYENIHSPFLRMLRALEPFIKNEMLIDLDKECMLSQPQVKKNIFGMEVKLTKKEKRAQAKEAFDRLAPTFFANMEIVSEAHYKQVIKDITAFFGHELDEEVIVDFLSCFPTNYEDYQQLRKLATRLENINLTKDKMEKLLNILHQFFPNHYINMMEVRLMNAMVGQHGYTGHDVDVYRKIETALSNHELITLGTSHKFNKAKGMVSGHEYMVINCFVDENGKRYVLVNNPWGSYSRGYKKTDSGGMQPCVRSPTFSIFSKHESLDIDLLMDNECDAPLSYDGMICQQINYSKGVSVIELSDFVRLFESLYVTCLSDSLRLTRQKLEEMEDRMALNEVYSLEDNVPTQQQIEELKMQLQRLEDLEQGLAEGNIVITELPSSSI